jgi:recombination protein RecA
MIGNRTKAKIVKNKVAPPFKIAEFDIMYGQGISKEGGVLDIAADLNIIDKSGAWYAYNDLKIGQGRDKAKEWLKENPEIMEEVEKKIYEKISAGADVLPSDPTGDDV